MAVEQGKVVPATREGWGWTAAQRSMGKAGLTAASRLRTRPGQQQKRPGGGLISSGGREAGGGLTGGANDEEGGVWQWRRR